MRLSIIIPTKDRFELVNIQLFNLSKQKKEIFEIIILDNSDCRLEAKKIKKLAKNYSYTKYIRTGNLNIVDNWNIGLQYSCGDYTTILTDKTFFVSGALLKIKKYLKEFEPDIFSWNYSTLYFDYLRNLDSKGYYRINDEINKDIHYFYSPILELNRLAKALKPRDDYNLDEYTRGKINFGFYSKRTLKKIKLFSGRYVTGACPDYSTRLAALYLSNKALHVKFNFVFFLHSIIKDNWSTGHRAHSNEKFALNIYNQLDLSVKNSFLVPGLYISQENFVTGEFISMSRRTGKLLGFSKLNWVIMIMKDLYFKRRWISLNSKKIQFEIFSKFVINNFTFLKRVQIIIIFLLITYLLRVYRYMYKIFFLRKVHIKKFNSLNELFS